MNEQQIKQILNKKIFTIDEIQLVLDYIVNNIKSKMDINHSYTRLCKESSLAVSDLCEKLKIPYIPFSLGSFGMKELEHHFGITGFPTEYGQICFLLDLTYKQFDVKEYPINLKNEKRTKLITSPGMFISEENKDQLINSRYLILTENNFEDYISSFIESYRLANKVDARLIYDKVYDDLLSCNINLIEKDYTKNNAKR